MLLRCCFAHWMDVSMTAPISVRFQLNRMVDLAEKLG